MRARRTTRTSGAVEISVVIPSLNSGRYIGEAVQSAVDQRPMPHEVIVQDGGSTDGTLEVLREFGPAVRVRSEPDEGQADALNRAIERTTGNVVLWLNADDLLIAGAFAAVTAAYQENPDADFVYGDFEVVDGEGSTLRRFRSSPYDPKRVFFHGCYIFSGAIFFRRETMERVGQFDPRLQTCMDFDYLMRIGEAHAMHVPQPVARFRLNPGQKSAAMRTRFLKESHEIRWRAAGRSASRRLLVVMLSARDAVYLLTHRLRFSSAWSTIRRNRQL